jgi:hypothetical protein
MSHDLNTVVVGFDLGHGETALSKVQVRDDAPPQAIDLPGSVSGRQHVTAIAQHPQRGLLVGENAITPGVTYLALAFKSPQLDRPDVSEPTRLFVAKVREDVTSAGLVPRTGVQVWVFGAPSGWGLELRAAYAELLSSAGFDDPDITVEVVPESRAALLYARDSGEVLLSNGQLAGTVLIVDLGSSTTDFTSVVGHRAIPADEGTQLGAALIEKTIMAQSVAASPHRAQIEEALQNDRIQRLFIELTCRRLKEEYFRRNPDHVDDPYRTVVHTARVETREGGVHLQIDLSAAFMRRVLETPQPRLEGRTWRTAFQNDLKDVAEGLDQQPDVVLLTGGASRMRFVQDIARDQFGADRVLLGAEPELAIARGLAIAGRIGIRSAGFRAEVRSLTTGARIATLVTDRLPDLANRLGEAAAEDMTEVYVIPAFKRWRNGHIQRLDQMATSVANAMTNDLTRPNNPKLTAVVNAWQDELRPSIEEFTNPICRRWHIPSTAMALPSATVQASTENVNFMPDTAHGTKLLGTIATGINVAILGVMAAVLVSSTATIVLAMGPLGAAIALTVAGVALFGGREWALERAQTANIPQWMRELRSEDVLVAKLREGADASEGTVAGQFATQFLTTGGPELAARITADIAARLEAQAAEAELLIS